MSQIQREYSIEEISAMLDGKQVPPPMVTAPDRTTARKTTPAPKARTTSQEAPVLHSPIKLHKLIIPRKPTIPILEFVNVANGQSISTDLENTLILPSALKDGVYQIIGDEMIPAKRESPEDFPVPVQLAGKPKSRVTIAAGEESRTFVDILKRAFEFTSDDTLRPAMTGILLDEGTVTATNGHVLFHEDFGPLKGAKAVILSQTAIKFIIKGLAGKPISITHYPPSQKGSANDYLQIQSGVLELRAQMVDATFPNYKSVIPDDAETAITLDRKQLLDDLRYLRKYVSATLSKQIVCSVSPAGELTILAKDEDKEISSTKKLSVTRGTCNPTVPKSDLRLVMPKRYDETDKAVAVLQKAGFTFGMNLDDLSTVLESLTGQKAEMQYSTPTRAFIIH
jgi:DNA polymerase III sliding clamp (beta) subunit (PCNA family)